MVLKMVQKAIKSIQQGSKLVPNWHQNGSEMAEKDPKRLSKRPISVPKVQKRFQKSQK